MSTAAIATRPASRPAMHLAGWRLGVILMLPAFTILGVFFFYPVGQVVWGSFSGGHVAANYAALITDAGDRTILLRTLEVAVLVAGVCLILAYPYAYVMTLVGRRTRLVMTVVVLLPFWTSLVARTFAWLLLEEQGGPISRVAGFLGFSNVSLLHTVPGVAVAMVQVQLPYMVLPLYSAMTTIDRRLLDAASLCGAGRVKSFFKIYLPLSIPGISAGVALVLLLSLGFFITPALLGNTQDSLISQIIEFKVMQLYDFAGAGAYSTVLLVMALLLLGGVMRTIGAGREE